jgi:DNA topoisomerase-1
MRKLKIVTDPVESAKEAGLRYVSDSKPGISRRRAGKGFRYFDAEGKPVRDKPTLARIRSLVIPPAWKDVWICPIANGHLQVTGRDAKGRKQSRYHPRWRVVRDETKYERMLLFGSALREMRDRTEHDLALAGLPREKVLAAIVRLMEVTQIRVGNEEYARANGSYGLTTLRGRHVTVEGSRVRFRFPGKSGVKHSVEFSDRRLARIVQRCQDIPGHELFEYLDDDGQPHTVDSADVNDYLRAISRQDFTAKDFRTWAGTVFACMTLRTMESFTSANQAKKNVVAAIKCVAQRLGNTPAVCRKCYVHPAVLEAYMAGAITRARRRAAEDEDEAAAVEREERALMELLRSRRNETEKKVA